MSKRRTVSKKGKSQYDPYRIFTKFVFFSIALILFIIGISAVRGHLLLESQAQSDPDSLSEGFGFIIAFLALGIPLLGIGITFLIIASLFFLFGVIIRTK